jgi:hypothetical protein
VEVGEVTQVSPSHVIVSTPERLGIHSDREKETGDSYINMAKNMLPYDYLLLASGSNYLIPEKFTKADKLRHACTNSDIDKGKEKERENYEDGSSTNTEGRDKIIFHPDITSEALLSYPRYPFLKRSH